MNILVKGSLQFTAGGPFYPFSLLATYYSRRLLNTVCLYVYSVISHGDISPAQSGFPNLSTGGILDQIIPCCWGCSVHFKMFFSLSGLHLLEDSGTLILTQSWESKMSPDIGKWPWGQNCPWLRPSEQSSPLEQTVLHSLLFRSPWH